MFADTYSTAHCTFKITALELRELVSSTTTRSVSAMFSFSTTARGGYIRNLIIQWDLACNLTFLTAVLLTVEVVWADLSDGVGDLDKLDIADAL